jgi:hypothetical protein
LALLLFYLLACAGSGRSVVCSNAKGLWVYGRVLGEGDCWCSVIVVVECGVIALHACRRGLVGGGVGFSSPNTCSDVGTLE